MATEPKNPAEDAAFILSLRAMESWLEERGWDALPLVLVLLPNSEDATPPTSDERVELLEFAIIGEGEPYEILAEASEPDALATVVATEAWTWPDDLPEEERVGRPSEHPRRVEVRSVIAVTRAGTIVTAMRPRGGEPVVEFDGGGPLVEAMRQAMTRTE